MNKTAIKNFAIWARNKLIADIIYKAGLLGITEKGIKSPLPQSTQTVQFFDIGTKEPSSVTGVEIQQRKRLVEEIERKAKQSDYATAYKNVIEEVAYTWFNRLIAIRFMEVNDYLPTRIRVLSSESNGKAEPDLVTHALEVNLDYSAYEKDRIVQLKLDNKLDELFRMLFIKQCNALNTNLPELFEKTSDYTELLLNVSFTDKEGVVYHLVNDIEEDDFDVSKEGQVEIIGWLYQYYNTEPKAMVDSYAGSSEKLTKEDIPAKTQLFTPDWIVRYMVENSLGRLWLEGYSNDELRLKWKYYLNDINQEKDVQIQLNKIREGNRAIAPEDIKVIDPAMGSGHILVYAFDVLLQIYESCGYSQRDAAKSIVEKNLYGLDIDNRAYQLTYFAVMMKARQYNRRILNRETACHVYAIQESNEIDRDQLKYFGSAMSEMEKKSAISQIQNILDVFIDAKEYGSMLKVGNYDWQVLNTFIDSVNINGQISLDTVDIERTQRQLRLILRIGAIMSGNYDVVVTNPPYMTISSGGEKMNKFVKDNYPDSKSDLFAVFIERCLQLSKKNKYVSMITMHSWMFLASYEKLRNRVLEKDIVNMVHLGSRAFDEISGEVVQTTSFVFRNSSTSNLCAQYIRLVKYPGELNKSKQFHDNQNYYYFTQNNFKVIDGAPLIYWISDVLLRAFGDKTINDVAEPRVGMATANNELFLRLWHEVSWERVCINAKSREDAVNSKSKWFPITKGGENRFWYGNNDYVVNWENDGLEIRNFKDKKTGRIRSHNYNLDYIFQSALTWTVIGSDKTSFRYIPEGFLYSNSGYGLFCSDETTKLNILGLMNSKIAVEILNMLAPSMGFESGYIRKIPYLIDSIPKTEIVDLVKACVETSKDDWDSFEESWDFKTHPFIRFKKDGLIRNSYHLWDEYTNENYLSIKRMMEKLNSIFIEAYELTDEIEPELDKNSVTYRKANVERDVCSFISYAIGCMFGRYSLDFEGLIYAGGQWDSSIYSIFTPDKDNIIPITDEEYFQDDIVGLFIDFVKKVYSEETLEENLSFIAEALGNKGTSSRETIRDYFIKDFFKDHSNIYSVNGSGKRPVYWLFDSGKQNGFKALVYMHRYDENTIGNLRIDYLHRMQRIYENEISRMQDTIENSKDAREVTAATKRKEKLIKQLQETKEYDEKIAHLALARTSIDLDDGVKVNYEKVQTDRDGKKLDVLAKI